MTTPTPPPGYKLEQGLDYIPSNSLVFINDSWEPYPLAYTYNRESFVPEMHRGLFYAIPYSPESITDEAKTIVAGDRASDYGDANESFARIAKLWSAYTGTTITPWDVAHMMMLLKVSRAKTSRKRDTLVDIVGYAECASKLEDQK